MLLVSTLPTTHVPNTLRRPKLMHLTLHLLPCPSIFSAGHARHVVLMVVDLTLRA